MSSNHSIPLPSPYVTILSTNPRNSSPPLSRLLASISSSPTNRTPLGSSTHPDSETQFSSLPSPHPDNRPLHSVQLHRHRPVPPPKPSFTPSAPQPPVTSSRPAPPDRQALLLIIMAAAVTLATRAKFSRYLPDSRSTTRTKRDA